MIVISRRDARHVGQKRYFTGISCKHGHICERKVSNGACVQCHVIQVRENAKVGAPGHARRMRLKRAYIKKRTAPGGPKRAALQASKKRWLNSSSPKAAVIRVGNRLRSRLRRAIKGKYRAGSAVRDLGCSIDEFMEYIAARFRPGMSWNNYGQWHLDHIFPLASFDLSKHDQFIVAMHYTNYQPLWATENIKKGTHVDWIKGAADEAHALVFGDWVTAQGSSPAGFDLATLVADLKAIS